MPHFLINRSYSTLWKSLLWNFISEHKNIYFAMGCKLFEIDDNCTRCQQNGLTAAQNAKK